MKKPLVLSTVTICLTIALAFAAEPEEEWVKTFSIFGVDAVTGRDVAVDSEGNVYVVGYTGVGVDNDAVIVKYDSSGNELWHRTFAGAANDDDYYFCVDLDDDFIYAGGQTSNGDNDDLLIVKYKPDGDSVWVRILDTSLGEIDLFEAAYGIAVDANYVYVTGNYSFNDVDQARTMIYDKDNNYVRGDNFDTPDEYDVGWGIAVDGEGCVYVAGATGPLNEHDFLVIKYDSLLNEEWVETHSPSSSNDVAYGIALDEEGYVFVAGTPGGAGPGFYTVCYDNDGSLQWNRSYTPYHSQLGKDVVASGDLIYVTGPKNDGSTEPYDFMTICYDRESDLQWEKIYDAGNSELAYGIAADGLGYLYVTGFSAGSSGGDMLTIKYRLPADITLTSPNGGEQWVIGETNNITWESEGIIDSVMIEYLNESVVGFDTIAVVANTGSYPWTIPNTPGTQTRVYVSDVADYAGVRDASDADFAIVTEGVEEEISTSLTLEVFPDGLIRYSIAQAADASLKIYAVDGSLVYSREITSEKGELRCDKLASGVYFTKLVAESESITKKIISIK